MINIWEVNETNKMVEQENLDVRTITIGISLLDCMDGDLDRSEPEDLLTGLPRWQRIWSGGK